MESIFCLASLLCAMSVPVFGAVPRPVTDMPTLVTGLQKGVSFRYQIDDISKCDQTASLSQPPHSGNKVTFDVSWELANVFINASAAGGHNSVIFTHERYVNGSQSGMDKPVLRQIGVTVNADGSMDVLVSGLEYQSFSGVETYSYTCLWNTSGAAAAIYQQDNGGIEAKDLVKAFESGYNLAFVINTKDLKPTIPEMSGWLVGKITELRFSPKRDIVFNWETNDLEMVSMFEVKTSSGGDSVSIYSYIYSRAKNIMTSSTTYDIDIGSVQIFSLPYGE